MFGIDSSELAVVVILALVFIGPKDLPKVMRTVGYWVGRVRGMARHFTAGIENMVREAELEEMEKRWREENERIMRVHPDSPPDPHAHEIGPMPPVSSDLAEPGLPFEETQPVEDLPLDKRPLP